MGLARKYILECTTGTPSGMSYVVITKEVTLLDAFSGTTDVGTGTTFSYSTITPTQLKKLSDEDYDQRVEDFLSFVGNSRLGSAARATLLSGSTYDEILCSGGTLIYPSVIFDFNDTGEQSTISFLLNGITVEFTGTTTLAITSQLFSGGTDGAITAQSFESSVNDYLVTNGISSLYVVTITNLTSVKITATNSSSTYNFGTINIVNGKIIETSEQVDESGLTPIEENRTYYEPAPDTSRLEFLTVPIDDSTLVVDFFGAVAPDALEIINNGWSVAASNMNILNISSGASSNYGYPNVGDFRYGAVSGITGTTGTTGVTYNILERNEIDSFYVGSGNTGFTRSVTAPPDRDGVVPTRMIEFEADTGINIPLSENVFGSNSAQQRIWVTGLTTPDEIEIHVTGAIPTTEIASGITHYYPQVEIPANLLINANGVFELKDYGGDTGWGYTYYFVSSVDGNIILTGQVNV